MPDCAVLEALCFPSFWTAEQFSESWNQNWFAGYGLFEEGRLLAYITLSVLAGELEVLNIAVHPDARGRGLSRPLMSFALTDTLAGKHLIRKGLEAAGWEFGVLEVRVGNKPARALYSGLGFIEAGLRRKYYSDGEDALIMTLSPDNLKKNLYTPEKSLCHLQPTENVYPFSTHQEEKQKELPVQV